MQFIIVDKEIADNQQLSMNEVMTYSLLSDRMRSSIQRSNFYDQKANHYYVIFTLSEMAKHIHVSKRTISKIFHHLKKMGLVIIKRQFNGAGKIFLPKFQLTKFQKETAKNATPKLQKMPFNHKDYNHIKKISDKTLVTKRAKHNYNQPSKKTVTNAEINQALCTNVINKVGINQNLINVLLKYKLEHLSLYKCFGFIFKTKKSVLNHLSKANYPKAKVLLDFKKNRTLSDELSHTIMSIMIATKIKQGIKNKVGYFINGLKRFFQEITDRYLNPSNQTVTTIKTQYHKQASKTQGKIKETLPDWAKDGYQPHYEKASLKKRLAVKAKLKRLNALTDSVAQNLTD